MNVTLITAWNESYQPLADIAVPLMKAYCDRHGYSLHASEYHTDPERLKTYGDRLKLDLFLKFYDDFDIVCWLDIDIVVMNSAVRVEDVLGERPFLWTYDHNGPLSSMWIARTTPEVYMLMATLQDRAVISGGLIARENLGPPHSITLQMEPRGTSDQVTMRALMHMPPFSGVLQHCVPGKDAGHCYPREVMELPQRFPNLTDYEPGAWLVTFPSIAFERRREFMAAYASKAL